MIIYRIEHKTSGLGPFQHGNQYVIGHGISGTRDSFPDLEDDPIVQKLLIQYKGSVIFGFSTLEQCQETILDPNIMAFYGFVIKVYHALPVYMHPSGQVIFMKE